MTVEAAAKVAGRSAETIREWCKRYDIGRKVVGEWMVSKVALAMLLDDDPPALRAYLAGDRESELVGAYFRRLGLSAHQKCGNSGKDQNTAETI